ncbi:MAG: hypothetical protein AAF708_20660 [Deinococcota bacterium]
MILFAMRLRGALNSVKRHPERYVMGLSFLALIYWGMFAITRRGVRFLNNYDLVIDLNITDAIAQRSLEGLFLILMSGVAFSVLTTAITTLYSSEDLPFLLSLPTPATRVFYLKVAETYLNAALLPTIFTLPVLTGIGLEYQAPLGYYPLAIATLLTLYAIPVAIGSFLALLLMRIAPAGRVKEVATALSVVLAAGLIFGLRALRPEQIADMTPQEFQRFLSQFAAFEIGWLPSDWASQAVWGALEGNITFSAYALAGLSALLLWIVARLAAFAYREGWIRSLESGRPKLDPTPKPTPAWERAIYRFGKVSGVVIKDSRLLLRDPTQWSQLLVLLALAGVYLVTAGSIKVDLQQFRDVVGTMNIIFLGFLLAGIGFYTTYPAISMEGEGFWLLRTGPLGSMSIVMTKFWYALPTMLLLGTGVGYLAAQLIDVSPTLAFASPLAGFSSAIVVTGLGVGLGAAFPNFDATNPGEISFSPGGLLYVTLALGYATVMTLLLVYPAWITLSRPNLFYWREPEGLWLLFAITMLTALVTLLPLLFGSRRLAFYEPGS